MIMKEVILNSLLIYVEGILLSVDIYLSVIIVSFLKMKVRM